MFVGQEILKMMSTTTKKGNLFQEDYFLIMLLLLILFVILDINFLFLEIFLFVEGAVEDFLEH